MSRLPTSKGRSPRLSMNADTLAFACASSPANNTSSGRPRAKTWAKTVLNAFTTCALAGTALAISCAPEEPSGVTSGGNGVGDVDDDLAGQRVPALSDDRHGAGA